METPLNEKIFEYEIGSRATVKCVGGGQGHRNHRRNDTQQREVRVPKGRLKKFQEKLLKNRSKMIMFEEQRNVSERIKKL